MGFSLASMSLAGLTVFQQCFRTFQSSIQDSRAKAVQVAVGQAVIYDRSRHVRFALCDNPEKGRASVVQTNFFSNVADVDAMLRAIRCDRCIWEHGAMH